MSSISASDYRRLCQSLIEAALQRPIMYFTSLRELEMLLRGHEGAFEQLHVIDRDEGFHACFGDWLYRKKRVSSAGGWSSAIDLLVGTTGDDPEAVFSRVVREFLAEWRGA